MQILLSKDSHVSLKQQLTEQIVFQITTGQLRPGDELPSVRALGRLSKVHHNTVSDAYQELVRRGWISRRPGSRLIVGKGAAASSDGPSGLDDLINGTIQHARGMGYTLQQLRARVRERLLEQPPDHLLVVEREPGLRELIRRELGEVLQWPVLSSSQENFLKEPGLAIGAQVVVPNHFVDLLSPLVSRNRPPLGLVYSRAVEQVSQIRKLEHPSIVSIVSVSESVLRTARSFLAPAIRTHHTLNEVLVTEKGKLVLDNSDLVFCDTITFDLVRASRKERYKLLAADCMAHIASSLHIS